MILVLLLPEILGTQWIFMVVLNTVDIFVKFSFSEVCPESIVLCEVWTIAFVEIVASELFNIVKSPVCIFIDLFFHVRVQSCRVRVFRGLDEGSGHLWNMDVDFGPIPLYCSGLVKENKPIELGFPVAVNCRWVKRFSLGDHLGAFVLEHRDQVYQEQDDWNDR